MKLVIDRKYWLRGKGDSSLLTSSDSMCPLGFLGLSCGISKKLLLDKIYPSQLFMENWPKSLIAFIPMVSTFEVGNTLICTEIMFINDDIELTDEIREKMLKEKFAEIDIDVEFVN